MKSGSLWFGRTDVILETGIYQRESGRKLFDHDFTVKKK
jgi:hypothetical protein